jgi:hypothetical protein
MTPHPTSRPTPARVRTAHVEWVAERLSGRDWAIVELVNRLRVVSSTHVCRLFFFELREGRSRITARTRALRRLVAWRVLLPLERRAGGSGGGSGVQLYALDSAGQRIIASRQLGTGAPVRVRRPEAPGERTLRHTLAICELYTSLVELGRLSGFAVPVFEAEPACWWPNGLGGYLKPDAHALLEWGAVRDHWWVEHDEATEGLPTVRRKIESYVDFLRRGQLGPGGIVPRVLVSAVTEQRAAAVAALVGRLPSPAGELVSVVWAPRAPQVMYQVLRE